MTPEVANAFFARYASEFDQCNWPGFAAFYNEPALSVRADGSVKLLPSRTDVRAFFESVSDTWHGEGYSRFRFSDLEVTPIGSRSALITLTWHLERTDQNRIRSWRQSYQLIAVGSAWRVVASTFHAP